MKLGRFKVGQISKTARRRLIVAAMIAVVVVGGLWLLQRWANGPTTTALQSTAAPTSPKPTATAYKPLQTAYFSTVVPSTWHVEDETQSSNPAQLQVVSYAPAGSNGQVGFVSTVLPSDGLSGVGTYNLRATQTANYARYTDPALPAGTTVFRATDGSASYTAYLLHGNRYASVGITEFGDDSQTIALLNKIVLAWQWK